MNREATLVDRFRSRWSGAGAFAATELRVQMHEGLAIAVSVTVQVIFLVFVSVLARSYLPYTLVGAVLYSAFQTGQRVQNEAAFIRIDHKLHELYHASPLTPEAYFLGLATGVGIAYMLPIVVLFVAAVVIVPLGVSATLVLAGLLGLTWVFVSSIGYTFSTLFHDMRVIWPYATLFYNLFGVLPPVFYPLWLFPAYLQPLALVLPSSGATALAERAAGILSLSAGQVELALASLVTLSAAAFLFALYWARRQVREG